MLYRSTRGQEDALDFRQVTLAGMAPDGGLYVPERWPRMTADALHALVGLSYAETAACVMAPFTAGVLDRDALSGLTSRAYASFSHDAVAPLRQLDERSWLLELFHGPTCAFKDMALQLLGLFFERFTSADRPLTLIGATSGDTGSAAIAALAGRANVDIVMLHPLGRVSEVQRRQMTTVRAVNVHNVAIEGTFDDAQALVKALFRAPQLVDLRLSAINSINWARLLPQIVYYVYAAVRLGAPERRIAFSVPTGNFGNVFAGYAAHAMGLPIERLIVATNANDIVHRGLSRGDYSREEVAATHAPSMDIQVSSNFERLLGEFGGVGDLADAMEGFERARTLGLPSGWVARAGALFASRRVDDAAAARAMADVLERSGELVDPHTAIGLAASATGAPELPRDTPIVTLATAHPAKFPDAVERATGRRPELPARLSGLFDVEERCVTLPAQISVISDFVRQVSR